ncbi:hypothetical protein SAMN05428957_10860 [Oryzisolibacter propanilivorax]|uniref:Uncharacterized protein n=1 Tax=Oryzisolibacter propanilivorax TaxID=1527607 RepID=A0A1G9U9K1_9BURK|nr:hypothetical protein [Oryzisolibacter propanilivorax]SDM56666.1 hypothetical protein SAMN05428957_10860 [Oryzisolibacter propanilivorax]
MTDWLDTCPVCGAQESLDVKLARMIDDPQVRGLVADVLRLSLPLGERLQRYLRLHKPPKQRLRIGRVRELVVELVADMTGGTVERHGRAWAVTPQDWETAFDAVFLAVRKGTLQPPLQGNGYLYQVLTRMADEAEAAQEQQREQERRAAHRAHASDAPTRAGALLAGAGSALPGAAPRPTTAAAAPLPGTSPTVRAMRAAIQAKKGEQP